MRGQRDGGCEMTKVVYNACYGGFSLSEAGIMRYAELKGITLYPEYDARFPTLRAATYWTVPPEQRSGVLSTEDWHGATQEQRAESNRLHSELSIYDRDLDRADPVLVQVVEELGDTANGRCAKLRIEDVPAGTLYRIDEYDGNESVMTQDTYEWKLA
jgi:hypothetical protein